jgi:hypothetical protein
MPAPSPNQRPARAPRVIGKARGRGQHPGIPREWTPILDDHPTAFQPDALPGYVWLQLPDRIREVHRQCLEFWHDPPGCALTDEELDLLRRIAAANAPVMFQAEGRTVPAHLAFDHRVDVLRDLRKTGWIVSKCGSRSPATAGMRAGAIPQPRPTVRSQDAKPWSRSATSDG